MYSYIGLALEFAFLAAAIYLYLFATGQISFNNPEANIFANKLRKENGTMLRYLSIAVAAIMLMNIIIHIKQLI